MRAWGLILPGLASLLCAAQVLSAPLSGSPPVTHVHPDLDVYPQNFDIAQDEQSVIYVANSEGVMIYDGARWKLVPLPNKDLVRALAYDGRSRVYAGGFDAFGYVERDANGQEQYHDLTPRFASLLGGEDFADIWDVHLSPRGVIFRALRHSFFFDPASERIELWRHPGRFGGIAEYRGETVLQFRGEGLKALREGEWVPLPGSEAMRELVFCLVELPDGGLLGLASDGRWLVYRDGSTSELARPALLPPASFFSDALVLADGSLALTGTEGHLWVLDVQRRLARSFRINNALLSGLQVARDGGLLTVSNGSVHHVAWPAPWTVIGADQGMSGSLFTVRRWGERWFTLTGAGVQEAMADGSFRRQDWSDHEAWDFLPLDERTAMLAESYTVKLIQDGRASPLSPADLYPRVLRRSRFDPDIVYAGTESGLCVLRRERGIWRLLRHDQPQQNLTVNSLVESRPREVWLGTERGGLRRLRLKDDYSAVAESRDFGLEQGLRFGDLTGASVHQLPGDVLVASTEGGVHRWDGQRFVPEDFEGLESLRRKDEWLRLGAAPGGDLWAFSDRQVLRRPAGDGKWLVEDVGGILQGALQDLVFSAEGGALFATSSSVLRHEPQSGYARGLSPRVLLRAVEQIGAGGRQALPSRTDGSLRFAHDQNMGFSFRFALPELHAAGSDALRYQVRLRGFTEDFSEWLSATTYTVTGLEPGEYSFELRARDLQGHVSEAEPWRFTVVPRWYATVWGRGLLAALALALVGLLNFAVLRWRERRFSVIRRRLEGMVAERTRELESANRQLQSIAHLDGLTEIPNRRRLDDYLSEVWHQCEAQRRPMSVLVIDGDHFKVYNDGHGHLAGDEVLRRLVKVLSHCLRRSEDLVARYGGDEFVVVMPGADTEIALAVAEAMRAAVERSQVGVTISIGIASRLPRPDEPVSTLVHEADEALYKAKREGRNRAAVYSPP